MVERVLRLTNEEIKTGLARVGRGLDQYCELRKALSGPEAAANPDFRRAFNHFYRVRRGTGWQDRFYGLLAEQIRQPAPFKQVLSELFAATGRVEASFASKLVATVDPDAPVLDRFVLRQLRLRLIRTGEPDYRLQQSCDVYDAVTRALTAFLNTDVGVALVRQFEEQFPGRGLTPMKMLDLVLWQTRPEPKARATARLSDDQRLDLIAEAVRYCQRVRQMGMPVAAYSKALREPIHFMWERRSGQSKVKCARYRSQAAVGLRAGRSQLVYDHAIPYRFLEQELLELDPVTRESVGAVLGRHCMAVLLTKDEDALLSRSGLAREMPLDWDRKDVLARYTAVGIEVIDNQ